MPGIFFKRSSPSSEVNEKNKKIFSSSPPTINTTTTTTTTTTPTISSTCTNNATWSLLKGFMKSPPCQVKKTEVVVIGNGPSGMALSFMLNGNVPYYTTVNGPHPVQKFNHMLNESVSLYEQNLEQVSEGLTGRSTSPISILFDSLRQPDIDFDWNHKTRVTFYPENNKIISHLVIGSGEPGGVWNNMQTDMLTVSYGDWMDLPGYSLEQHLSKNPETEKIDPSKQRVLRKYVSEYYRSYPSQVGTQDHFLNNCTVLSISLEEEVDCKFLCKECSCRLKSCTCPKYRYALRVQKNDTKSQFWVRCNNVVFASGVYDKPKTLEFQGNNLPIVYNNVKHFLKQESSLLKQNNQSLPVIVVGSGLSAADAILHLMDKNIPVVHIYHRSRGVSPLSKCPKASYPEYARLYQMMKEKIQTELYEPLCDSDIISLDRSGHIIIKNSEEMEISRNTSAVLVLIGSEVSLNIIPSTILSRSLSPQNFKIDPFSFQVSGRKGLYAIGSLAGDNFVRFAVGSSFGVARSIYTQN